MNDEYIMLRKEIDNNMKQMHQYFAITSTAVFAVLTYIFNNPNNPNIFIAIFVVLICIASRVKRLLEGNVSISTYMEVFLEPNIDGRNWEIFSHYRINGYNSHGVNKRKFFIDILLFRTNSTYFLLSVIMYILYITVLVENFSLFNIFSGGIFNTVALIVLFYTALFDANNKNRDKYLNYWKEVEKQTKENLINIT